MSGLPVPPVRILKSFVVASLIALAVFAAYLMLLPYFFETEGTLPEFASLFDPLGAVFTALAFFGLVLTALHQSEGLSEAKRQLEQDRNERIDSLLLATRLQVAGLRLVAMAIEKDQNRGQAKRELELMVAEAEDHFAAQKGDAVGDSAGPVGKLP